MCYRLWRCHVIHVCSWWIDTQELSSMCKCFVCVYRVIYNDVRLDNVGAPTFEFAEPLCIWTKGLILFPLENHVFTFDKISTKSLFRIELYLTLILSYLGDCCDYMTAVFEYVALFANVIVDYTHHCKETFVVCVSRSESCYPSWILGVEMNLVEPHVCRDPLDSYLTMLVSFGQLQNFVFIISIQLVVECISG